MKRLQGLTGSLLYIVCLLPQQFHKFVIKFQMILSEVFEQTVSPQHLRYLDELISIAVPHEKGLLLKYHRREHRSCRPDI